GLHLVADDAHGLVVALGSDGEAGLENVHAQLGQLVAQAQLLGHRHAAPGGLFAVAQRGVEDVDAVVVGGLGGGGPCTHERNLLPSLGCGKFIIIAAVIRPCYATICSWSCTPCRCSRLWWPS